MTLGDLPWPWLFARVYEAEDKPDIKKQSNEVSLCQLFMALVMCKLVVKLF